MDQIEYLIKLGKSQGFINYSDFREASSYVDMEQEDLDNIFRMLKDMGIEIRMENAEVIDINRGRKDE